MLEFKDMINTIQLGDCYELVKQIPDKSIDLVYIDIPYDFEGNGNVAGGGSFGNQHRDYHKEYEKVSINSEASALTKRKAKSNYEMSKIAFGIDYKILDELCRTMKYIYIYIWCSKKQIPKLLNYFLKKGCYWELYVWHKNNPIPTCNNKYLSDTEYCLIFREDGTSIYGSYETKAKYYISNINKEDKEKYLHPTIKPLEIVKNHLVNSTKENDLILDCFCGSGTTCVAAKETGRRFIGIEIDPKYHKIAVDRLNGINANGQTSIFTDFENLGL